MKVLDLIQIGRPKVSCINCAFFQGDPKHVENTYPGIIAMSSGYASVRDRDGLCSYHQIYLSADDGCENLVLRED